MNDESTTASGANSSPLSFTREFSGTFNDEMIRYRAVAAETLLRDGNGRPSASFFTIAYLRIESRDSETRPVTFVFNGGPGSSAQWLHMGALGPKRVVVPQGPENMGAPPYLVEDNTLSFLDRSDLVFIDPIGTGYSRTFGERVSADYWGVMEDARSIADFIENWVTANGRWNSPKYLVGESYGTVRACVLAEMLAERYVALNGMVLIAPVLDYQNSRPRSGDGGILSYVAFLPTYAAIAMYHGRVVSRALEVFLEEVRTFARTDYALALIANAYRLHSSEQTKIVSRVAAYSGLRESYVAQSRLRIPVERFFKELLREQGQVVGRLDGRYTSIEADSAGETADSDPALDAISAAFTSALHGQLREIGVKIDLPYVSWAKAIMDDWRWSPQNKASNGGGCVNVVPNLARVMRRNSQLRVYVALGYYDLATPFFGAENALSQDGVVQERVSYAYYEAGHMIFLDTASRIRLLTDIRRFICSPLPVFDNRE